MVPRLCPHNTLADTKTKWCPAIHFLKGIRKPDYKKGGFFFLLCSIVPSYFVALAIWRFQSFLFSQTEAFCRYLVHWRSAARTLVGIKVFFHSFKSNVRLMCYKNDVSSKCGIISII